jgi:hypothetical protein
MRTVRKRDIVGDSSIGCVAAWMMQDFPEARSIYWSLILGGRLFVHYSNQCTSFTFHDGPVPHISHAIEGSLGKLSCVDRHDGHPRRRTGNEV